MLNELKLIDVLQMTAEELSGQGGSVGADDEPVTSGGSCATSGAVSWASGRQVAGASSAFHCAGA